MTLFQWNWLKINTFILLNYLTYIIDFHWVFHWSLSYYFSLVLWINYCMIAQKWVISFLYDSKFHVTFFDFLYTRFLPLCKSMVNTTKMIRMSTRRITTKTFISNFADFYRKYVIFNNLFEWIIFMNMKDIYKSNDELFRKSIAKWPIITVLSNTVCQLIVFLYKIYNEIWFICTSNKQCNLTK